MFQLQLFFCSTVTNGTALQLCRDTSLSQELHYCSQYKLNNTKHDAKGVGMIRAEIGLKNRQIINETYSFRCYLSSIFFKSFHYSTAFSSPLSKSYHYSTYFYSIFFILFHYSTFFSSVFPISFHFSTYFSAIFFASFHWLAAIVKIMT